MELVESRPTSLSRIWLFRPKMESEMEPGRIIWISMSQALRLRMTQTVRSTSLTPRVDSPWNRWTESRLQTLLEAARLRRTAR